MKDKEIGKKPVKVYSDLTKEQKKNIAYLPEFTKKDSLKALSSNRSYKVSGEKADTLLFSDFTQHASLNADRPHKVSASITEKTYFSGSNKTSSGRIQNSNIKKSTDQQENIRASNQSLTNNQKKRASLKKEEKNILYLFDHFKKTGETQVSAYKTADKIIPFPDHKHHPFLLPAGRKLQSAGIVVMACLLVVLGGKAVITGIDNISVKMAENTLSNLPDRRLAVKKPTPPTPSEIIQTIVKKEIKITKAASIQTRTVASSESPELSHDTIEPPATDPSL